MIKHSCDLSLSFKSMSSARYLLASCFCSCCSTNSIGKPQYMLLGTLQSHFNTYFCFILLILARLGIPEQYEYESPLKKLLCILLSALACFYCVPVSASSSEELSSYWFSFVGISLSSSLFGNNIYIFTDSSLENCYVIVVLFVCYFKMNCN